MTGTHVLWNVPTGAPYTSSLLYYRDLLYMATEVGVVRCVDPGTGETIWTESSHKFVLHEIPELARRTGFRSVGQWVDGEWPFAENLWLVEAP